MLLNARCTVVLYADQRYRFSTTITAAPKWGKSRSIAISRPERIEVIERRRFVRTTLAPSSRVRLSWETGSGMHHHSATLLNVSPRGLACRIEEGAAESIASGSYVVARFELPSCENTFEIRSAVQSKTPASEGMVILGMHFDESDENATHLAALRGMLERADEALLIQHEVTV
jgi:c-di-GMP-binding flagellar brake protein YcgR